MPKGFIRKVTVMATWKSPMEGQTLNFHLSLLHRKATFPVPVKQLEKDIETMKSRFLHEGLSFLTKTLPLLGKALDVGLATRRFTTPLGFRNQRGRNTPAFLQVYFNRVFTEDGVLREDACVESVSFLRQVLFFAYKLEVPYDEVQESKVIDSFLATEEFLASVDLESQAELLRVASFVVQDALEGFDPRDIVPRHGPGAVATGERLEQKWVFSRLYDNIHQYYPYYEYFVVGGWRELGDRYKWYKGLTRQETGKAKVVLVPKDSRGPRLISCEPLEYQWIQQGLGRKLAHHLERHKPTKGQVNFTNQEINRELAQSSSATLEYATIDLKDASDRVSIELVRRVFGFNPETLRALMATRTTATVLPDGREVTLKKFAPMGSALCFPVEALCFFSVMVAAVSLATRLPRSRVAARIYVYGDDIVVPTAWVDVCMSALESVGLAVNRSKTCIEGPFRESCGMDAFRGVPVTPTRIRTLWSGRHSDGAMLQSYTSTANELRSKGYDLAADTIFEALEELFGKLPYGTSDSGFPCRVIQSASVASARNRLSHRTRWNRHYQRLEFKVLVTSPRLRELDLHGWPRLLKDLVVPSSERPSSVVVPRSTKIKRGWRAA
jgi:hypothetical protein